MTEDVGVAVSVLEGVNVRVHDDVAVAVGVNVAVTLGVGRNGNESATSRPVAGSHT